MAYAATNNAVDQFMRHAMEIAKSSNLPEHFQALISLGFIPQQKRLEKPKDPITNALYEYHVVGVEAGVNIGPTIDARDRLAAGGSYSLMLKRLRNQYAGDSNGEYDAFDALPDGTMPSKRPSLEQINAMYNADIKHDEDMTANIRDARTRISCGDSDSLMVLRMRQQAGAVEPSSEDERDDQHAVVERLGSEQIGTGTRTAETNGDSGSSSSKLEPVPQPEPLVALQAVIDRYVNHFSHADNIDNDAEDMDAMTGNDQLSPHLAALTRGHLCTLLSRVLLIGFQPQDRFHIWDFVLESCRAIHRRGERTALEQSLIATVVEVNTYDIMGDNPNVKFRTFVCSALNHRKLAEWLHALTADQNTMNDFYGSAALFHPESATRLRLLGLLQSLNAFPFELTLDYEYAGTAELRAEQRADAAHHRKVVAEREHARAAKEAQLAWLEREAQFATDSDLGEASLIESVVYDVVVHEGIGDDG